jgi:hypothetical protein
LLVCVFAVCCNRYAAISHSKGFSKLAFCHWHFATDAAYRAFIGIVLISGASISTGSIGVAWNGTVKPPEEEQS